MAFPQSLAIGPTDDLLRSRPNEIFEPDRGAMPTAAQRPGRAGNAIPRDAQVNLPKAEIEPDLEAAGDRIEFGGAEFTDVHGLSRVHFRYLSRSVLAATNIGAVSAN